MDLREGTAVATSRRGEATGRRGETASSGPEERWREAGRAWGARAVEWAYLFEPYVRPANVCLFDELGVGPATRLLDVACGSGLAVQVAAERGADVAGIDAAEGLIGVARARTPAADLRVGDMFALPFADGSFDVVTSFNGIWKGCDEAVREARRVMRPGGRLGLTFWGDYDRLGLMPYFLKVIELSPVAHGAATVEQGDTGQPGVVEEMLRSAGFEPTGRGTVSVVNEWPDVATAVRALAAAGPSVPAIEQVGYDRFCAELALDLAPMATDDVGLRIANEWGWVTAVVSP